MIHNLLKSKPTSGRVLLLVLAVVCAALLTGDCTAREETAPGGFVPVIAAIITAAIVLIAGAFVLTFKGPGLMLWATISISAWIGMFLAIRITGNSASLTAFFTVWVFVALVAGVVVYGELNPWAGLVRSIIVGVVSFVSVIASLGLLMWIYLSSADVCIGFFGVDCGTPDPFRWVRFAILVGLGPSVVSAGVALSLGWLCRNRAPATSTE